MDPIAFLNLSFVDIFKVALGIGAFWAYNEIKSRYDRKKQQQSVTRDLTKHSIFFNLDSWINYKINAIDIPCPLRSKIFKDFLKIKFKTFRTTLAAFVRENYETLTPTELENKLKMMLYNSIKLYEEEARSRQMPEIVIQKFNQWHAERVATVEEHIRTFVHNEFISDNVEKIACVFDALTIGLHNTLIDAEKTLKSLNGQLNGLTYQGVSCGVCKYCAHVDKQN